MRSFSRFRFLTLMALVALSLGACQAKRLTPANVTKVTDGMSRKQVESILGPPTAVDETNLLVMKKVTYEYKEPDGKVTIIFTNDQVSEKESNLRE
ncbi:MAG: outer membrane protein assembly factor BamE domain-containing protein [Chthoniobacterales bacterium]